MVKKFLIDVAWTVAKPVGSRLGTAFAAYLIAKGVPQDAADQLLTALGVLAGLTLDAALAYVSNRKRV
ncbi:hypothetical protein [Rhizobium straminoryzae]|uniref:Uncharacterized protein n=1 Tax=Rhizobium straminoryzae TaxID=1387186 RepID=A0A549TGK3_9HYPH|nr:hypothetical protein [Rhizobium straminoryzae]TRL41906.1 hypothetical protein FNA46_03295 [Rhizobium straminoryzae]